MKKTLALILLFLFISDNIQSQIQKNVNKEKIYNSSLQSPLKNNKFNRNQQKEFRLNKKLNI